MNLLKVPAFLMIAATLTLAFVPMNQKPQKAMSAVIATGISKTPLLKEIES